MAVLLSSPDETLTAESSRNRKHLGKCPPQLTPHPPPQPQPQQVLQSLPEGDHRELHRTAVLVRVHVLIFHEQARAAALPAEQEFEVSSAPSPARE